MTQRERAQNFYEAVHDGLSRFVANGHTPGPWSIRQRDSETVDLMDDGHVYHARGQNGVVRISDICPDYPGRDFEADCRLIAASPTMYDGFVTILDRLATNPMQDDELADFCRSILRKAGLLPDPKPIQSPTAARVFDDLE